MQLPVVVRINLVSLEILLIPWGFEHYEESEFEEAGNITWIYQSLENILSNSIAEAGQAGAGCPGSFTVEFLISPWIDTPQPLWENIPVFDHL